MCGGEGRGGRFHSSLHHSHTLNKGGRFCELGEPGPTVLAKLGAHLSLSTPSPLRDKIRRGDLFCPPGEFSAFPEKLHSTLANGW